MPPNRISSLKRGTVRTRAACAVQGDRVIAHVDGIALQSQLLLERLRADFPRVLGPAGGRRATDRPETDGLRVEELTGFRGLQLGNADIALTERALPCPDASANTLPIYPKPADLPGGGDA